jgi:hypothetical protein
VPEPTRVLIAPAQMPAKAITNICATDT